MNNTDTKERTLTLLEAAEQMHTLDGWFEEHDEQIAANEGEVPQELAELLDQAYPVFKERIDAVAAKRKSLTNRAAFLQEEAKRLRERAAAIYNRERALLRYQILSMQVAGEKKVEGVYSCTLQNTQRSVEVPEIANIDEAQSYPGQLVRVIPARYEIDKTAVLQYIDKTAWDNVVAMLGQEQFDALPKGKRDELVRQERAIVTKKHGLKGITVTQGQTVVIR